MIGRVKLEPAHCSVCPGCVAKNYADTFVAEASADEVTCSACGMEYGTTEDDE